MKEDLDGVTLTSAYGRNPESQEEAVVMFDEGKDWIINHPSHRWAGKPCSIRDCGEGDIVKLRYNSKRDAVMVEISGSGKAVVL